MKTPYYPESRIEREARAAVRKLGPHASNEPVVDIMIRKLPGLNRGAATCYAMIARSEAMEKAGIGWPYSNRSGTVPTPPTPPERQASRR